MSKKTIDRNRHENTVEILKDHCIWEMRASKDINPSTFGLKTAGDSSRYGTNSRHKRAQYQPNTHKTYINDNRHAHNNKNIPSKRYDDTAMNVNIGEGEFVLFDDIETNWSVNIKDMKSRRQKQQPPPAHNIEYTTQDYQKQLQHNQNVLKMTKMIGQMPIADYEGSPRRFGNQPVTKDLRAPVTAPTTNNGATTTMLTKRAPGFPLRISPMMEPQVQVQPQGTGHVITKQKQSSTGNLIDIDDEQCVGAVGGQINADSRQVLEEFFEPNSEVIERFAKYNSNVDDMQRIYHTYRSFEQERSNEKHKEEYIGQRLAQLPQSELYLVHQSPVKQPSEMTVGSEHYYGGLYIDSLSRSSVDFADTELEANLQHYPRNFTLSPETTDYDSNCGDLDSSSNDINCSVNDCGIKPSSTVLEDALSSGHASDIETNAIDDNIYVSSTRKKSFKNSPKEQQSMNNEYCVINIIDAQSVNDLVLEIKNEYDDQPLNTKCEDLIAVSNDDTYENYASGAKQDLDIFVDNTSVCGKNIVDSEQERHAHDQAQVESIEIQQAMKEIRSALQRAKKQTDDIKTGDDDLPQQQSSDSPVWVRRKNAHKLQQKTNNINYTNTSNNQSKLEIKEKSKIPADEEDGDTDHETDRLLGQQKDDDQQFFDDKLIWSKSNSRAESTDFSPTTSDLTIHTTTNSLNNKPQVLNSATIRQGLGTTLTHASPERRQIADAVEKLQYSRSPTNSAKSIKENLNQSKRKARNKEDYLSPEVLIEGVLFRARYLGSTQLVCEGQPTKSTRMMQAEEAVSRIKAPEGESQPSTEVDLFISTEKIMVLNTDLKEIMMDHSLRTISYIADIGDLVVLMARRRFIPTDNGNGDSEQHNNNKDKREQRCSSTESNNSCSGNNKTNRTPKMICHVFESEEAQFIAQSIGQAFQVAYMEFLKANGIEDHSFVKEMDYQEVLNSQEIFGDELQIFAKKELQKEVVVPKAKGEILGVVIVESGWGSMLPTVVIANLMSAGAAARCGQLNIGDQLIAINGLSLVGLPLSTCQNYIRNAKNQTAVKFTVVPCPPVVEVKIKRPNTKYQLGFSVQNGVICSLLRGGIAERGGVRVGHRIIEINNQSVVAVPHEKIVNMLATSVGEILMKTMPTSMFRLLTGQETPIYI